jgi:hypothetical protein
MSVSIEQARVAKGKVKDLFSASPSLQRALAGVGIGRIGDDYAVKVNLSQPLENAGLPDSLDGVPIELEVIGKIHKLVVA